MLGLNKVAAFFWTIDDSGPKSLQKRYERNIYAVRIAKLLALQS